MIPIHNEAGELVAYAGRAIDGTSRVISCRRDSTKAGELYNLHRAIAAGESGPIAVVEGFLRRDEGSPGRLSVRGGADGLHDVRGAGAAAVEHAGQVLLLLDGDEAGRQGTDELLARLGRHVWTKAVTVPEGKQAGSAHARGAQPVAQRKKGGGGG